MENTTNTVTCGLPVEKFFQEGIPTSKYIQSDQYRFAPEGKTPEIFKGVFFPHREYIAITLEGGRFAVLSQRWRNKDFWVLAHYEPTPNGNRATGPVNDEDIASCQAQCPKSWTIIKA